MIYLLIWAHFVCDFILQTDAMAKGKSSSNIWLAQHVYVYTSSLLITLVSWNLPFMGDAHFSAPGIFLYCFLNGLAHFGTDYVTSRITKKLWAENRTHDFFVVIGMDQAIHMSTLVATLPLLTHVF